MVNDSKSKLRWWTFVATILGGFTIAKMVPKQHQKQWIINSVIPKNTVFAMFLLVFESYRETPYYLLLFKIMTIMLCIAFRT